MLSGLSSAASTFDFEQGLIQEIKKIPAYAEGLVSVQINEKAYDQAVGYVATDNFTVSFYPLTKREVAKVMTVRCALQVPGKTDKVMRLKFKTTILLDTYVANGNYVKDTPLSRNMFITVKQDQLRSDLQLVTTAQSLEGKKLVQNITAATPLYVWQIAESPVVVAGDKINVRIVYDGIVMRLPAEVLQDGCIGRMTRVKILRTGKVFKATVLAKDNIEIQL